MLKLKSVLAVGLFLLFPVLSSFATPVGQLDIAAIGSATVSFTVLDFVCGASIIAPCPNGTYGNFTITAGTGGYVPYVGQGGYVDDISQAGQPLNTLFSFPNWLILPALGGPLISFELTFIELGSFSSAACGAAPAAGQVCTPDGIAALVSANNPTGKSAFNLLNQTATSSIAGFAVRGIATDTVTLEQAAFLGLFSAQFNVPYQTLLATLATGGSITNSYSATFTADAAPIPEPATFGLVGAALLVLGVGWRRKPRS